MKQDLYNWVEFRSKWVVNTESKAIKTSIIFYWGQNQKFDSKVYSLMYNSDLFSICLVIIIETLSDKLTDW